MHDRPGVMALDIAVVSESSVHERCCDAIRPQTCAENLRFWCSARLADKSLEDLPNVILRRGSCQQATQPVIKHFLGSGDYRCRHLLEGKILHELRNAICHPLA